MSENYGNKQPAVDRYKDGPQDSAGGSATAQELRNWLVSKVAELTGIEPREIGVGRPFTVFGVTSKDAVLLSGELAGLLGRQLSPALLYDYPTIESVVRHLTAQNKDADSTQRFIPGARSEVDPLGEML